MTGGNLTRAQVREVLDQAALEVQSCHALELSERPGLQARIRVGCTVQADGSTSKVAVKQAPPYTSALQACLLRVVRGLRFPAPEGGWTVDVETTFDLRPPDLSAEEMLYWVYHARMRDPDWLLPCWRSAKNVQVPGEALVQVTIAATGRVVRATTVRSTLESPVFESCLLRAIRGVVFPNEFEVEVKTSLKMRFVEPGKPDLDNGTLAIWGDVERVAVRRVLEQKAYRLRRCWGAASRPAGPQRLLLQTSIGGDGKVLAASLRSATLEDPALERCLLAAVRTWRFPRPGVRTWPSWCFPSCQSASRRAGPRPTTDRVS